jgi:hypothetical protein
MSSTFVVALLAVTLQQPAPAPDSVIARAMEAIRPLTDTATLRKAGFGAIGFGGGAKDLSPFQGQHWVQVRQFLANQPVSLDKPNLMMYLPVGDSLVPIGVAYTKRVPANTPSPTDIGGIPAGWHVHIFCTGIPGQGQLLADGVTDCLERGGNPAPNQITMVHAWTVPNPDGPYGHDNPLLPFLATGLKPPQHFMRDERLFAIAIAESYGARLMAAGLIERYVATAGTPNKLAAHRAAMREHVRELLAAEKKGDTKAYEATKKKVMATWATIVAEYHAIAPTPQLRKRFDTELEQLLNVAHHHGG